MAAAPLPAGAGHLFRGLFAAERTCAGYAELVALVEHSSRIRLGDTSTTGDIFHAELGRLRGLLEEHEADADDRRAAILLAGIDPEQYEAWSARQVRIDAGELGIAAHIAAEALTREESDHAENVGLTAGAQVTK